MPSLKWDEYFYNIALAVSENSRCLSRKIGVIIVQDERFILSSGYNGPPIGFPNPGTLEYRDLSIQKLPFKFKYNILADYPVACNRRLMGLQQGEGLRYCPCAHAERNSISIAARNGIKVQGCSMYLTCPIPCYDCSLSIVNAGIIEIVVSELSVYDTDQGFSGQDILNECDVKVRKYAHL